MRILVTGAAGFIGSHTVEALLDRGDSVRAADVFTEFYDPDVKRSNIARFKDRPDFELVEVDLAEAKAIELLSDVDAVIHLSAQPGVRPSWQEFETYVRANIHVTQRLLEAARQAPLRRVVYASSSSVYGRTAGHASREDDTVHPFNPYGVSKLAAEQLCSLYAANWQIPTVSLRYFTVYGSRQRPDMLVHRTATAALAGTALPLFGSGDQARELTHVSDVVAANLAALDRDLDAGTICNIGGGSTATVREVVRRVEEITGREVALDQRQSSAGDVPSTRASIDRAVELLDWRPAVSLGDGLAEQIAWHSQQLAQQVGVS